MDDVERTTRVVRTDEVAQPANPVGEVPLVAPVVTPVAPVAAPVYEAQPVAAPVYAAAAAPQPAAPVYAAPVYAAPAAGAASTRVVTEQQRTSYSPSGLEMTRRIVTLAFGVLQALLILRIVLLLLVANRDNDIVAAIINITNPFVAPFADMFSIDRLGAGNGSVFDFGALVALIGWTLIELLILAVLNLFGRRRTVLT